MYIYENGFEPENTRSHGYPLIKKPYIDSYNWQAQKRNDAICVLHRKALIALDHFEQNINKKYFMTSEG